MSPEVRRHISAAIRSNVWRIGLSASLMLTLTIVTYAQATVDPTGIAKSIVDVAGKDGMLASMYILGLVAVAAMWFAWQQTKNAQEQAREQSKVMQELAIALTKFATKLDRAKCMAGD